MTNKSKSKLMNVTDAISPIATAIMLLLCWADWCNWAVKIGCCDSSFYKLTEFHNLSVNVKYLLNLLEKRLLFPQIIWWHPPTSQSETLNRESHRSLSLYKKTFTYYSISGGFIVFIEKTRNVPIWNFGLMDLINELLWLIADSWYVHIATRYADVILVCLPLQTSCGRTSHSPACLLFGC